MAQQQRGDLERVARGRAAEIEEAPILEVTDRAGDDRDAEHVAAGVGRVGAKHRPLSHVGDAAGPEADREAELAPAGARAPAGEADATPCGRFGGRELQVPVTGGDPLL